jgi:ABC-type amino acid transport substrate-binding protein
MMTTFVIASATLLLTAGCSGGDESAASAEPPKSDIEAVTAWKGWNPTPNPLPPMNCTDDSYSRAVSEGVTMGLEGAKPYNYVDPATNQPMGIDVDIVQTALKYAGITKIDNQVMPFDSLVPALQGEKIDMITANIHVTEPRLSQLGFSSPGWWYGPQIVVRAEDKDKVTTYDDLVKPGISVGTVSGSINQTYLEAVNAPDLRLFKDKNSELAALRNGEITVALEDTVTMAEYLRDNPESGLVLIDAPVPDAIINDYGYGYARYGFRLADCSLNLAFSRALGELRDNGVVLKILTQYGLSEANVTIPGL